MGVRTGCKRFPVVHSKERCELNSGSYGSDVWRSTDGTSQCSHNSIALFESEFYHGKLTIVTWQKKKKCLEMKASWERFANLDHPLQFLGCFSKPSRLFGCFLFCFLIMPRMKSKISYHCVLEIQLTPTFSIKANCRQIGRGNRVNKVQAWKNEVETVHSSGNYTCFCKEESLGVF